MTQVQWLPMGEASKVLGLHPDTIKRQARTGKLERQREPLPGGRFRWLIKVTVDPEPQPSQDATVALYVARLEDENAWLRQQLDERHSEQLLRALLERVATPMLALASRTGEPMPTPSPRPEPLLLKVNDVAQLLSISRSRAYRLVRDGVLPRVRIGTRGWRVPREQLQDWIDAHTIRRAPAESPPPPAPAAPIALPESIL